MGFNSTDTTITLRNPEELLREVPALLGFVPQESLVAILLDRSTLRCTLRWDLEADLTEQAIRIIGIAHRAEADGAVLVLYTDTVGAAVPVRSELDRVADLLEEQGIAVHDLLWVSQGRWGSHLCAQPACCPSEGRPLPVTTAHLEVVRVAEGRRAVAASRQELRCGLEVRPEPEDSNSYRGAAEALVDLSRGEAAVRALRALEGLSTPEAASAVAAAQVASSRAFLALAVQDVAIRDYVLGTVAADCQDLRSTAEAVTQAALCAPERLRPVTAATAMALLALDGQSSVALWRMHELADGQSLAALVAAAVEAGFPPQELRDLFVTALPDVRRQLDELDHTR